MRRLRFWVLWQLQGLVGKALCGLVGVLLVLAPVAAEAQAQYREVLNAELDAANECAPIDTKGMGRAVIDVTGTFTGTLTFYVVGTGGTRDEVDAATPQAPGTFVNTTTAAGLWQADVAGYAQLFICMTSYTNGAARVNLSAAATGGGGAGGGGDASNAEQITQTTHLNNIETAVEGATPAGNNNIGNVDVESFPSAQVEADDDNIAFTTSRLTVNAVMYCEGASNNERCASGDGGSGAVSANTSRTVEANVTKTYDADIDETKNEIDDDSGVFCGFTIDSLNTSPIYLQWWDLDSDDVTVGTTSATAVIGIPEANASGLLTANIVFPACIAYSNALTIAATTTRGGSTGPASIAAVTVYTR
jgi:hypothetical protein